MFGSNKLNPYPKKGLNYILIRTHCKHPCTFFFHKILTVVKREGGGGGGGGLNVKDGILWLRRTSIFQISTNVKHGL